MFTFNKKAIISAFAFGAIILGSTACTNNTNNTDNADNAETTVIKVAASATPMTDAVLAAAEAIEDGYTIELIETSGYFTPNVALQEGEVDANFIQHKPHMEDFNAGNDADLVVVAPIYYVVGSFYSKKYDSLNDLPENAEVVIPNDSNGGRALELLQEEGLIKLAPATPKFEAELSDIIENAKNLKFKEVDLMNLNVAYDESDAVFSLGSFARQIGLFPETDGLANEFDERFAVSLVSRSDNLDSPEIKALEKAFKSDQVRETLENLDQKVAF